MLIVLTSAYYVRLSCGVINWKLREEDEVCISEVPIASVEVSASLAPFSDILEE